LSYLLRRAFRGGQAYVFLLFRRNRLKAVFRVLLGVAQLAILPCVSLLMLPFNRTKGFRLLLKAAQAAGKLSALSPLRVEEYKR
ncbi:MAG: hypothetical protein WBH56_14000, partial [Bacteroidota bacterium]